MNTARNMNVINIDYFREKLKKDSDAYTDGDRALNMREVASKLNVSDSTIRRLIRKGEFPAGRRFTESTVRWLESDVDKWMKSRQGADNADG